MVEMIQRVILITMLTICSIQDVRGKRISLWIVLSGAILISSCLPFRESLCLPEKLGGAAIGVTVIIISRLTAGKIGMGDALILCVTGLGMGFWGNLELFAMALLFASIVSIVLLVFRLANRKKSIPFVPFILGSYVFLLVASR